MITVRNWIASIPEEEKHLAYVGEGKSTQKVFLLCGDGWEAYRDWSFHLDMLFDLEGATLHDQKEVEQTTVNSTKRTEETVVNTEETTTKETYTVHSKKIPDYEQTDIAPLSKTVQEDGIRLVWTVLCQHTRLRGKLRATIRAVGGDADEVKKSAIMVFEVDDSIKAEPALVPPVSEFAQIEAELDDLRQQAYSAAEMAINSSETSVMAADSALHHMQTAQEASQSATDAAERAAAIQTDLHTRLLPEATAEDNGKILTLVDGAATWVKNTGGSGNTTTTTTQLVPHALSGGVVTITDSKGEGLPMAITTPTPTKVFVGGANWWPDGDMQFTHYKNNQPLPLTYPAGQYTIQANVNLVGESAATYCLLQLKNLTTSKTTGLHLYVDGRRYTITVSHPFNAYSLFAGEGNTQAANIEAHITNMVLQYGSDKNAYVPYRGVVYETPAEDIPLTDTPTLIFADNQEEVAVTYHTTETVMEDAPSDTDTELPAYYLADDYLPDKVSTINTLLQRTAANGDAFIFITDQHTEQNKNAGRTPALLRYLSEHTKVRRLFSGGDLGLTQEQQVSYHAQMEQAFAGDIHYVMGNHEYDMLRATDADLYYIHDIHKPDQIGNAARHYYYVDNPQQKIRYVVVNNWESKGVGEYGGTASDLEA